jgi:acetyltransferase-like isoleucine patch superfamily enzyme
MIARPPVNAQNSAFRDEITRIFDTFHEMPEVRAIVLTGEGRNFSAGADLKDRPDVTRPGAFPRHNRLVRAGFDCVMECGKPVIAAVNGAAIGAGCVLGNACEFKNCLLMDGVQVPHFSYVGDSILGNGAHFGAGVICSNLRLDQQPIVVRAEGAVYETGLRKFGAIVGDRAEVGCNAVLNPGTVLGRRALVTPAIPVSGYIPAETIAHGRPAIHLIPRRD